jgi:hypothetical protein
MSEYSDCFENSIKLMKKWGETQLSNGKTLSEHFTFKGISFWEIISPEFSLYQVTKALSQDVLPPTIFKKLRPHITLTKHEFLNYKKRIEAKKVGLSKGSDLFLFLGFSGYMYRDVLHPVARYLLETDNKCPLVIHDGQLSKKYMAMDGVKQSSIWQYWNDDISKEVSVTRSQVKHAINEFYSMNILQDVICFQEKKIWLQLEEAFNWLFKFHFKILVPQIVLAEKVLAEEKPSLIISADIADMRTRIYNLLAKNNNIPVLEIQFGPLEEGLEWQFLLADKVAVWGQKDGQKIIDNGIANDRIIITGSPRHDGLVNMQNLEIDQVRKKVNIPQGARMILVASTYRLKEYDSLTSPELIFSMKRAVIDAAGQVEGVYLVVKPHPLEDVSELKALVGNKRNVIIINPKEDIRQYVKACDVFISFGSTVTIDAMIANKLTICPVFEKWIWSDLFISTGATLAPTNKEEILSIYKKIADGSYLEVLKELQPALHHYLQDMLFKNDGKASERVAQIAMKMRRGQGYT